MNSKTVCGLNSRRVTLTTEIFGFQKQESARRLRLFESVEASRLLSTDTWSAPQHLLWVAPTGTLF
jgi:hypothetical protein